MKYTKECEHCQNIITAYTHTLNRPLVESLRKLVDFYEEKKRGCNLQSDLNLSKNQYNNFQKLQYFRLVFNRIDGWVPTFMGTSFIEGKLTILNPVATFGKSILPDDHEAWGTHNSERRTVGVQDIDIMSWKRREEYKEEKRKTLFAI